jgi:hypothetical protein
MRNRSPVLIAVAVVGLMAGTTLAATHRVGPGQPLKTLRTLSLSPDLHDGDVIEVEGGSEYCGDVATWKQNGLTIRGVGAERPHLKACGASEDGKAIWIVRGSDFTVENLEFSGAEVDSKNGAGIRAEGGGTLTVRGCYFHDNQNGILGGGAIAPENTEGSEPAKNVVIVEYSVFDHNGAGDGQSHNLYISQRVDELIFRYNLSRRANVGHNLKSRANKNYVLYNLLADGADGNASFQVDLPNGGLSYLIGNVIQQGPKAENSTLVAYSLEASELPNASQELFVINNTLVNTRPEGANFIKLMPRKGKMTLALVRNNVFYGKGEPWPETDGVTVVSEYNHVDAHLDNEPRFVSPASLDFRLAAGSPLIDAGCDPGSGRGYDLKPAEEYVNEAKAEPRPVVGKIDIGAYEFSPSSAKH